MKKLLYLLIFVLCLIGCSDAKVIDEEILYYIVELNDGTVVLAPEDYKPENHDSFKNDLIEVNLASPIMFCDTTINTIKTDNIQKEDLIVLQGTVETITDAMDFGCPYVFVECNENNEVDKIILYGELALR